MTYPYTSYVRMALRFYCRYPEPEFKTAVDEKNWKACELAIKTFKPGDQEILKQVYALPDQIGDNVYQIAQEKGISQEIIWMLMKRLERKIAVLRDLK